MVTGRNLCNRVICESSGQDSEAKTLYAYVQHTFSVAVAKYHDQSKLEKEGLIWFVLPGHSPSLRDARAGS